MMEKNLTASIDLRTSGDNEETEAIELVLYQVPECYVYLIPPRKSAASYRADEWDVNKWAWEGALKVISKGEECIIRLEDKSTGELYARAFLRDGEPHPVEAVIDSSRYFVLRVEENIGGRIRHAFIGIGFRERTEAYDFQAALHDHMKYLNKKKTAEEMEHQFQNTSSVDYSLKEGETLVLQLKSKSNRETIGNREIDDDNDKSKRSISSIKLPPPPPPLAPLSPVGALPKLPTTSKPDLEDELKEQKKCHSKEDEEEELNQSENPKENDEALDDDFGDFQAAG